MKKEEIYVIIGGLCIGIGACIISTGLCFIIIGIMFLIGSFLEYCKQEDEEEPEAPSQKKEIWHDIDRLKPPKKDGVLILRSPDNSLEETIVGYWSLSANMLKDQNGVFYRWYDLDECYVFDKWCYLEDLIEKRN